MHRLTLVKIAALSLLLACTPAQVVRPPETFTYPSPAETVEILFAALDAGHVDRAAALFDSATVKQFREGMLLQISGLKARGVPAKEFPIPGAPTYEEVEMLSPREVLARFLQIFTPGYRQQQLRDTMEDYEAAVAEGRVMNWLHPRTVIGEVIEGADTLAHVVFRVHPVQNGVALRPYPVSALTLVRTPGGWRVRDGDFEAGRIGLFSGILRTPDTMNEK